MKSNEKTYKIVMTGLMMACITVFTMVLPIPIPGTGGYIHLGDAVIFLSVLVLGWKYGAVAAAVGSGLADLFLGAAVWMPWTICIKGLMAIVMGLFIEFAARKFSGQKQMVTQAMGMVVAGIIMAAGYYLAEGVIYGNFIAPILTLPWNIGQFTLGTVVATTIAGILYKSPARKFFAYKPAVGIK